MMKLLRCQWLRVVCFLWSFSILAEEPFSFEKTPGKLPKTVVPRHYELALKPDLESMSFTGSEVIEIEVLEPVSEVVLNSHNLTIATAHSRSEANGTAASTPRRPDSQAVVPLSSSVRWEEMSLSMDVTNQCVRLRSATALVPGLHYLRLNFSGKISTSPVGMFLIKYKSPSGPKKMIATQFEATDARQVFPCFDEPAFRATFSLTVEVPLGITPVSNMPVARSVISGQASKKVSFLKTPSMPTYLLVLVVGELDYIAGRAGGIDTRVWFTEGKRQQALYALKNSERLLAYYQKYFGVAFPLPKLDHIALPGGFGGAMEHWGAITYNESTVLFDPAVNSQDNKERSFAIMAHEMAHQWFGNLVTMAWWDNLWLNEGFASWMGTKATDFLNPSWNHWLRVDTGKVGLMVLDAQKSTHPIQRPVMSESQIGDSFDGITYQKGMFFIRMLEDYLGEQKFQQGLQSYMKRHAFGNTTTSDLWIELAKSSQQPVTQFAAGWTEQPGLPVILASSTDVGREQVIVLRQERFTLLDPKADPLRWKIPATVAVAGSKGVLAKVLLEDAPITLKLGVGDQAIKLNAGSRGYYRTAYDKPMFERLRRSWTKFPESDQVNFLSDAWAMVETERLRVSDYLDLIPALRKGTSLAVWEQALGSLGTIDALLEGHQFQSHYRRRILSLLQPVLAEIGVQTKAGESPQQELLRAHLIGLLGAFGSPEILAEARRRFAVYLNDPSSLTGALRPTMLRIVGQYASNTDYAKLLGLARAAVLEEESGMLLSALAGASQLDLAGQTLALSLAGDFSPIQSARLVSAISATGRHAPLAWDFMKQHHRELMQLLGGPFINMYAGTTVAGFSDEIHATEYVEFIKANYPPDALAKAEEAADRIRYKAHLKRLISSSIQRWIEPLQTR